ncbi:MAG: hypoxanthine phosphoribosyltransferase [Nitrospinae bacterium]|nr:hypoxanthine phosphoribosyltransferase [Nitrospinota bacterium]
MNNTPHKILISEEQIATKVDSLAKKLASDLQNSPTLLVGLLNGSVVFLSDLMRRLYAYGVHPEVDFIAASSYKHGTESSGIVEIIQDTRLSIEGKTVVLVDDVVDTGLTLSEVKKLLEAKNPARVLTCVLLDKPSRRKIDITPDYSAFTIDDVFVIGYGMDAGDRYRNLPYLAEYEE